jgi:hypothetical protein
MDLNFAEVILLVGKKTVYKTRILWWRWLINQMKGGVALDEDLLLATFLPTLFTTQPNCRQPPLTWNLSNQEAPQCY